jgi:hypothetical protein
MAAELLAVPVGFVVGIPSSALGSGAAQRATTWTWFIWLAFVGVRLLQQQSSPAVNSASATVPT